MLEFLLSKELKNKKVKIHFTENIEPHEIFLDKLAQKKEEELGISEKKFEVPLSRNILRGFLIFALVLILFLLARTFQFQMIEGKTFRALSQKNKFTIQQISAQRGVIYDKRGNQLVWNKSSFDLVLDIGALPSSKEEKLNILKEVSEILKTSSFFVQNGGVSVEELIDKIEKSPTNEVLIAQDIPHQELILLETKIVGNLPGFKILNNQFREYKTGFGLAHLIGYTAKIKSDELKAAPQVYSAFDWVGRSGLEKSYEEVLRRNPGKLRLERDAKGNLISQEIISLPESGKSLVLWLDSELQLKIKEELEKILKLLGTHKGVGVALDPKTGGVLALVSLPDFDNNLFQNGAHSEKITALLEDEKEPLFNRVISGKYLTGSTIKPLIAAAALQEKIISPLKQIYSPGYIEVRHRYNPEIVYKFRDWAVHGWVDMRKAIAQSSNVYFYTIGGGYGEQNGLGPTKIKEYLELFGWGQTSGIDLPGEVAGFIPDIEWKKKVLGENWLDGDTYNLSIGQQYLQITPLEVVAAFTAIANGGKLLRPRVVHKIVDAANPSQVIKEIKPEIIRENFIKEENLQIIREGMRQAVTGLNSPLASAKVLNSLPVSSAAKTGTAQLGKDYYHNWVTVFAPYEDPQIVLTIMIENIKGVQAAALPVAKEVLNWYFTR